MNDTKNDRVKSPRKGSSQQDRLVQAAECRVAPAHGTDGTEYLARTESPHIVTAISPKSPAVDEVVKAYQLKYGKSVSSSSVRVLVDHLEREARAMPREAIHMRSAHVDGNLWIDTAWACGSVLKVGRSGWHVQDTTPVRFLRGAAAAPLADPREVTGSVDLLKRYVNCDDDDFALALAALIASWFDDAPQPILALFGPADAGKSTAMQMLVDLVDPRGRFAGVPFDGDQREIKSLASLSRVLCYDNVSHLRADESDQIARIATGTSMVNRRLYSDADVHITELMRPVWLNGIMSGFSRGDLASRAVMLNLLPIESSKRLDRSMMDAQWDMDRAAILAGLLDLTVHVLRRREDISAEGAHRMAEYRRVLAVIDDVRGSAGLARLSRQAQDLSDQVLDSTTLGMALRQMIQCHRDETDCLDVPHLGTPLTSADLRRHLVAHLIDERQHRDLPPTDAQLKTHVTRLMPDVERVLGVRAEKADTNRARRVKFVDLR